MKKNLFLILSAVLIVIIAGIAFYLNNKKSTDNISQKKQVITTLFPLYDMAKSIGGDKIEATLLLPPGVEAHSFEPTPSDIVKINSAVIFVYTGDFMEPWAKDIINGVSNKKLIVVNSSQNINMIPGVFHDEDEPAGSMDPHVWLDFDNAKIMADNIASGLILSDPTNADYYKQNLENYKNNLTTIDNEYRSTLATCKSKDIIYGGHYAFGYLAKKYNLNYLAAQGVSPDAEPTAKDLINLVNQIKTKKIKYVFYEELTSPKIAQTIADETDAQMLLLNAAHNITREQLQSGTTFFDILNFDLKNLKTGLEC